MKAASARSSRELLDAIQSLARLDGLEVDDFAGTLAGELAARPVTDDGLAARDAAVREALAAIDSFAARAMRIRLEHALADDTALPAAFRATLAGTVLGYADDLGRLRQRVAGAVARQAPGRADGIAAEVVDAAEAVLALRGRLADAVLAQARSLAAAALPVARAAAADRTRDDSERARWSCVRQELEAVVAAPGRVAAAPWPARVAGHAPVDERATVAEPSFGELIELE